MRSAVRHVLTTATVLCLATQAHAFDAKDMLDQCDAPVSALVEKAAEFDLQSSEWNNINLLIQDHRRNCGGPIAVTCHFSENPDMCVSDVIAQLDVRAEEARGRLIAYAESGNPLFGTMKEHVETEPEARIAEREAYCRNGHSESAIVVEVLGGNREVACRLDVALSVWATLAFIGSAPVAFDLLPPQ